MRWKDNASSLKTSSDRKKVVSMFSDTLSTAVLLLCEIHKLSYEAAAERCEISPRYYGSIARKEASPSIIVLEKICRGFQLTPNDLLMPPALRQQLSFRLPKPVIHTRSFPSQNGFTTYPVCPQCGITLEREYQHYCDRCGQCLDWRCFSKAIIVLPNKK